MLILLTMSIIFTYNLTLNEKLLKMGVPGVAMASVCTIVCMCMFFTYLYLIAGDLELEAFDGNSACFHDSWHFGLRIGKT